MDTGHPDNIFLCKAIKKFIELPESMKNTKIKRLDNMRGNGVRYYSIDNTNIYPSVTSILGQLTKHILFFWKRKVGEEVANQISKKASERGSRMHDYCEKFLLGQHVVCNEEDVNMFKCFAPELEEKIDNIQCLETPLYSHVHKYAGTVDCIADYDGVTSIIDFKTSSNNKDKSKIVSNYFLQVTAYSIAYEELTGNRIDNLVILMGIDGSTELKCFKGNRVDYEKDFINTLDKYSNTF